MEPAVILPPLGKEALDLAWIRKLQRSRQTDIQRNESNTSHARRPSLSLSLDSPSPSLSLSSISSLTTLFCISLSLSDCLFLLLFSLYSSLTSLSLSPSISLTLPLSLSTGDSVDGDTLRREQKALGENPKSKGTSTAGQGSSGVVEVELPRYACWLLQKGVGKRGVVERWAEMPSVAVKLYSVFFKILLKHRLRAWVQGQEEQGVAGGSHFGVTCRPEESVAAINPSLSSPDGVATKDLHIDPLTSLSIRIFLPASSLCSDDASFSASGDSNGAGDRQNSLVGSAAASGSQDKGGGDDLQRIGFNHGRRRSSYGGGGGIPTVTSSDPRRCSHGGGVEKMEATDVYRGYLPSLGDAVSGGGAGGRRPGRRLPVILQFHGGAFISGSNVSVANDRFCRRIAKLCDVIVIAVGYRLAPESRYPAAFEDGLKALSWLAKQANLAECSRVMENTRGGGAVGMGAAAETRRSHVNPHIADTFGASMVEPWLAAHGDPSRFRFFTLPSLPFIERVLSYFFFLLSWIPLLLWVKLCPGYHFVWIYFDEDEIWAIWTSVALPK